MSNAFSKTGEQEPSAPGVLNSKRGVRLWLCLGLIALLGVTLSHWRNRAELQRQVVAGVHRAGGYVFYDFEMRTDGAPTEHGMARIDSQVTHVADSPALTALDRLLVRCFGIDAVKKLHTVGARAVELDAETIRKLAEVESLRSVSVRGEVVDDAAVQRLARNRALKSLGLSSTRVTDAGLEALRNHPNLHELGITRSMSVTDASIPVLSSLKLSRLSLDGSGITSDGLRKLQPRGKLFRLVCAEDQLSPMALQHLARLPDLVDLTIDTNNPQAIEGLAEFRRLRPDVSIGAFDRAAMERTEEAWRRSLQSTGASIPPRSEQGRGKAENRQKSFPSE
jgi:CheY-like chemotaxis protein